jgi:hypothetical protein
LRRDWQSQWLGCSDLRARLLLGFGEPILAFYMKPDQALVRAELLCSASVEGVGIDDLAEILATRRKFA